MKIVIFQPMLKQYRVPLFERMGRMLEEQGHHLRVICGSPPPNELSKGDNVLTNNNYCIVEKSYWFYHGKIHFLRHALSNILWADYIITEQANKHIHNYILIFLRIFRIKKFAYWGHGKNRQGNPDSWREIIKKYLIKQCDWWFAYTQGVANYVAALGYSKSKITNLNNSIDTSEFIQLLDKVTTKDLVQFKKDLLIDDNTKIGLFCGSLYKDKNLNFLLASALIIHQKYPNFLLLVVGDGKDREMIAEFANRHTFVKYLGPLFGTKKALAFKSSDIFLCPGLVGLAILDAFTASLPIFTTDIPHHSPEIEYLQQGFNGVMTSAVEESFAQAIIDIFNSPFELNKMRKNALISSHQFSIESMAQNFVDGINSFILSTDEN